MLKHVLVTLDGSELAEQALAYAERILPKGGEITLLSVVDVPGVDVSSPAILRVELVVQVDPAPATM